MEIVIVVVCLGAGLNLALWFVLHRKLAELPRRVWRLAQTERAEHEVKALTALQEAAAAKVGMLVLGLRSYHDELEAHLKAQVAEAEVRARVAERRSSDAGVALGAASALVTELRGLVENLPRPLARGALSRAVEGSPTLPPEPGPGPDEASRATVEIPRDPAAIDTTRKAGTPEPASRERPSPRALAAPAPEDDEPEEERTHVAPHPLPGLRTLSSAGPASSGQGGAA